MRSHRVSGYLREFTTAVAGALGPALCGLYVGGSYALGDFGPGSDLDVAAVVERRTEARLDDLVARLRYERLPPPARELELVVYAHGPLRDARVPPEVALELDTGPESTSTSPSDSAHWFVIDLDILRTHGCPLQGPPPAALIAPRSRAEVLDALDTSLLWHLHREPRSANSVLNACRGWAYALEGRWLSKTDAGGWALARRPASASAVNGALADRSARRAVLEAERVRELLLFVREEVRRAQRSVVTRSS